MANRSRLQRQRPGGSGFRRQTAWSDGVGGTGLTSLSVSGSQIVGSSVQASVEGVTIVRQRGLLNLVLLSATSAGDGFQGAVGIGLATLAALAIGITAVPTPITEQDAESWLWWHSVSLHQGQANGTPAIQEIVVDSKAMRKFPTEMGLYAAIEIVEIGAATASVFLDSRVLVKLP